MATPILEQVPILCYVQEPWAYFTTKPLHKQQGDDWNDAPYEHNAGSPYTPREGENFKIVKLAFEGEFREPSFGHSNSPFSVDEINRGAIAWLRTCEGAEPSIVIHAGTPLDEFIRLVKKAGGKVYVEI